MVRIRGRWHDAGVLGVPPGTPGKQAAAAFALYGLRLQSEGVSPGPIEATVTITDRHGDLVGQLDLDARDAQWMVEAISWKLNRDYGQWTDEDIDRMLGAYREGHPATARHARPAPRSALSGPARALALGEATSAGCARSARAMLVDVGEVAARTVKGPAPSGRAASWPRLAC